MKIAKDNLNEFEQALLGEHVFVLRLYVGGTSPKSVQAINNIKKICEEHLAGQYDLEVVDIYQQPQVAVYEQVVAAPTLVKQSPPPLRRLIGNLSNTRQILQSLGLSN